MRELTDAEAKVLVVLLGNTAASERDRLRQLGLPRSTYHAVRRRAYTEGWLRDRYVPDPAAFGYPEASLLVQRPFADSGAKWSTLASADPGCVLLWEGAQFGLALLFHPSAKLAKGSRSRLASPETASSSVLLAPVLAEGEFPVYFDFEGIWSNVVRAVGTLAYPRGLPRALSDGAGEGESWTPRSRWAATQLLQRPFGEGAMGRPAHLVGPFGVPGAQRRLIESGTVAHRVLADPARLPPFQGRKPAEVVLATGVLREGSSSGRLFLALTRECRVFPFLFTTAGSRVLLGSLGQPPGAPAARPASSERTPVMEVLQAHLGGIEIFREDASRLRLTVDHRYDRLLPVGATS
ncbi:MAG: hypothetical protein L3K07_04025 [Thermoplasmata archaeon]|nr:hypothetical protein [Thermoplasmata archaeon]